MSDEKTIFAQAMAIAAAEQRQAFLERACGEDAALRAHVEGLLAAHERVGSFLESPPSELAATTIAPTEPGLDLAGTTIGHYKLLERIGEGGMGAVYMAEQLRPVKRRVALKIIKPGLDTKQVIARFEAERQALAMMDHPSIAKVFDAGATDSGRSYFVMELVRGVPITEYCDQHQLNPRQRLALFVQVCQAVQHAHQKGIIHRDLKPNNVLVTLGDGDKPIPKVIDFGIAKATGEQRLTDRTLFTEFRQLIGTPLYMSPEQAEMSQLTDVDTRSDVYSLGVLLYELLTGTTPFDKQRLAKAAYDEVRRILREDEPPRPSTRLSTLGQTLATISAQRQSDPKKLSQTVRGELDWIVMKALEKDRARRYETANGLARDVERYLADQPVEACPPSRVYRLRKTVRRNKAALTTAAIIAIVLVAATAVSSWEAVRARRAERQTALERNQALAAEARAKSEEQFANAAGQRSFATSKFVLDILGSVDPERLKGPGVTVVDAILEAIGRLDAGELHDQPVVEMIIRNSLGRTLLELGRVDESETQLHKALALERKHAPDTADTTLTMLGAIAQRRGDFRQTEALFREALELAHQPSAVHRGREVQALTNLGTFLAERGRPAEAEPLLRQAVKLCRSGEIEPTDRINATSEFAELLRDEHKYPEAEKMLREALADCERSFPDGHPNKGLIEYRLAAVLLDQSRPSEAEAPARDALAIAQATSPDDVVVWGRLDVLAQSLQDEGRCADAEPLFRQSLAICVKSYPAHHRELAYVRSKLGSCLRRLGKFAEAEQLFLTAYPDLDPDDEREGTALGLVRLYVDWGKPDEAAKWRAKLPATRPVSAPTTNLVTPTEAISP